MSRGPTDRPPEVPPVAVELGSDGTRWFYQADSRKLGPVNTDKLCRMLSQGGLSPQTPVWREGLDAWKPAAELPEFSQAVTAGKMATATTTTERRRSPTNAAMAAFATLLLGYLLVTFAFRPASALVTGVVTADSRPVSGGSVVLAPVAEGEGGLVSKPGVANVGDDGTFALRLTAGPRGLAKRFYVRFSPPVLPPMTEEEAKTAVPPYLGLVPRVEQVEITPGQNHIEVRLVPVTCPP